MLCRASCYIAKMIYRGSIRASLMALMLAIHLSPTTAQTISTTKQSTDAQPRQTNLVDTGRYIARCVEELDVAACKLAEKRSSDAKEKSEVLTYEYVASPLSENNKTSLDRAIRLDPQNALAYFLIATRGSANADESVKAFRKAIDLRPEWKRYYVDVALLASGAESYKSSDDGLKLWQLALESAPDDPRVYAGFGRGLMARGKSAEAEAMFEKGVAANSSDSDSAYELCSMYIAQKNVAKLRPMCTAAIAGLPSYELDTLAYQLNQINEHSLAEAAYRKALEVGPDPQHVREFNLGSTLIMEGKGAEAAEIYKQYLATHPDDASNRLQYALALESAGEMRQAEEEYRRAAEQHSDCETLGALGRFYLHQKKSQQAFDQFDKAFQEQWDCPTPVYFLTQEAQAFGPQQREIPQFEDKILSRGRPKPDEKVANTWYRFGNLAKEFGRTDDAAAAYRKTADLDPKQAYPLGGLGWVLCDAGRYQEAVAAFEEAEKRQPGYLKSAPEVQKLYERSVAAVKGKKP